MLNKNNIFQYFLVSLLLASTMISCNDNDGYSLDNFRISLATVVPKGGNIYYLTLDDGTTLWPAASDVYYRPKENQRVFVNYTLLSDRMNGYDHFIKVNDIWNVLTKKIIKLTEDNQGSIGNDPIRVNDIWIGDHYLNTSFSFNFGGIRPHAINMVQNTIVSTNDDNDTLELEFRHNAFDSSQNALLDGFACFDLRPFRKEDKESIPIIIKYKDWDGDKTIELVYKFNGLNDDEGDLQKAVPTISTNEYN